MSGRLVIDQHDSVFRNLGKAKMKGLTEEAGFDAVEPKRHRGSAQAQVNGDGRIDVVVSARPSRLSPKV